MRVPQAKLNQCRRTKKPGWSLSEDLARGDPQVASDSSGRVSSTKMRTELTATSRQPGKITSRDRRLDELWRWAPWVAMLGIGALPPAVLALIYLLTGGATLFLLLALSAIPFSIIAAILSLLILLFLRRRWLRAFRERLASDGITADEVPWFMSELTSGERRALKDMDKRQPLLADAYRETLALRLNASRLVARSRRDLLQVERRINRARYLNAPDTAVLLEELQRDRARLETLKQQGSSRRAEAEARLQMIEAAASRGASWAETNYMLQRLDEGGKHVPIGLEVARAEQQLREDTESELRKLSP
jgi:hypothetical protein